MSSAGETKSVNHSSTKVFVLSGLFSVDTFTYVSFDEGTFVISSDVANNFDCDSVVVVVFAAVVAFAVLLFTISMCTITIPSIPRRRAMLTTTPTITNPITMSIILIDVFALDYPSKGPQSDIT